MTKEELKQKAEEYALEKCKECYMCNSEENGERGYCPKLESRKEGYIASAEPREKRIAELERKLEQTEKDLADYQFNYPTIKELQKENAELKKKCYKKAVKDYCELEKENAELKEKLKPENCLKLLAKEGYIKFTSEQLTKAKELIERLLITSCNSDVLNLLPNCSEVLRVRVEAEQFLSEVEK